MPYIQHPNVTNERTAVENGRTVLVADTTVVLDCGHQRFSRWARDVVEHDQERIARRYGFDEVRLVQI